MKQDEKIILERMAKALARLDSWYRNAKDVKFSEYQMMQCEMGSVRLGIVTEALKSLERSKGLDVGVETECLADELEKLEGIVNAIERIIK